MEYKDIKRPRIVVDMDPELIKEVKYSAIMRGVTLKQWFEIAAKMLIAHDNKGK